MTSTTVKFARMGPVPMQLSFDEIEDRKKQPKKTKIEDEIVYGVIPVEIEGVSTYARVEGIMGEETLSFEFPLEELEVEDFEEIMHADESFEQVATIVDVEKAI